MDAMRRCQAASRRLGYLQRRLTGTALRREVRAAQCAIDDTRRVLISLSCLEPSCKTKAAPQTHSHTQTDHELRRKIQCAVNSKGTDTDGLAFGGECFDLQLWVCFGYTLGEREIEKRLPIGFEDGPLVTANPAVYEAKAAPVTEVELEAMDVIDGAAKVLYTAQPLLGYILRSLALRPDSNISPVDALSFSDDPLEDMWRGQSSLADTFDKDSTHRTILFHLVIAGLAVFTGSKLRVSDKHDAVLLDSHDAHAQFLGLIQCAQSSATELLNGVGCTFCQERKRIRYLVKGRRIYDWKKAECISKENTCGPQRGHKLLHADSEVSTDAGLSDDSGTHATESDGSSSDSNLHRTKADASDLSRRKIARAKRTNNMPPTIPENPPCTVPLEDVFALLDTLKNSSLKIYSYKRLQRTSRGR
eukprot:TRINITY_DN36916_c0_g2_i2.p1 TRINITY_DN36916_c0_g2~~TRINITY_DN36916_c0_g2_i2.p1  ORF type:complete len:418 (+),score=27.17 TRINITY_DN36916_c0_g2_i2:130-1383(+)